MLEFQPFDPLEAKSVADTEVASHALKREIKNILNSYVGWYDPFCELIQNSLDSVEERSAEAEEDYVPTIWITVNIQENQLSVTDNGVGLDSNKYQQFLAPNFSFKEPGTRGHKGVGATYLAYGFNKIQICSKREEFTAIGKMENARDWLNEEESTDRPKVVFDNSGPLDANFDALDRGVSITLKFDQSTHPKNLNWIVADSADSWLKILSVKTGLGAFTPNEKIKVELKVIKRDGEHDELTSEGIEYLWIKNVVPRSESYSDIKNTMDRLYARDGQHFQLPTRFKNLDAFYDSWDNDKIASEIELDEEELPLLEKYEPELYFAYLYSAKIWDTLNTSLGLRSNLKIIHGGIQIAANNMPQGEIIQIPLKRYIGRQQQVHIFIHFSNCSADLGRKGFHREIVDFAKSVSSKIVNGPLAKLKSTLRSNSGAAPDLMRQRRIERWKEEMVEYESQNQLLLVNENFFKPVNQISITSKPTREQDVIALFNQLIAGGVIRGIRIMSTNERFTYDGLYRVVIEEPKVNHIYHAENNPLGVLRDIVQEAESDGGLPFVTSPKVLEYKFSLDGLIENLEDGSKNSNDIGLVVVWETGNEYQGNYRITSLLDNNNLSIRQYHGLTHQITNTNSGQWEMDLIVLSELIEFLNEPETAIEFQIDKYEAF